jgi:hypothetical protein
MLRILTNVLGEQVSPESFHYSLKDLQVLIMSIAQVIQMMLPCDK